MSWDPKVTGLGPRDIPKVGVFAALIEADEDIEEELSARGNEAEEGGLVLDVTGGLNGRGTSFIPLSLAEGSFGLDGGRGGGTIVPTESGVDGRAGGDTVELDEEREEVSTELPNNGSQARRSLLTLSVVPDIFSLVISSLEAFRIMCAGLCLEGAGERDIFPIETFSSSREAIV